MYFGVAEIPIFQRFVLRGGCNLVLEEVFTQNASFLGVRECGGGGGGDSSRLFGIGSTSASPKGTANFFSPPRSTQFGGRKHWSYWVLIKVSYHFERSKVVQLQNRSKSKISKTLLVRSKIQVANPHNLLLCHYAPSDMYFQKLHNLGNRSCAAC